MVCQRECFNCGDTDDVHYCKEWGEFYCDLCKETREADGGN